MNERRRRTCAALMLVLFLSVSVSAQQTWYQAYEEGVRAVQRSDWTTAELRLKVALQARPNQGRRVLWYGTRREDYIPEFYLAIVYASTGRHQQAVDLFAKVQRDKLIVANSPEYPRLIELAEAATKALTPTIARTDPLGPDAIPTGVATPERGVTPSRAETVGVSRSASDDATIPRSEAEPAERFKELQNQAMSELSAGRLDPARVAAEGARATGVNDAVALQLIRRIDAAAMERDAQAAIRGRDWTTAQRVGSVLRDLDPSHPRLPEIEAAIAKGLARASAADVERSALRAFFTGDYAMTIVLLERATSTGGSPRALFYLACSHVAVAFLEGSADPSRLQQARELYSKSRPSENRFASDRRYISPRILEVLDAR